MEETYGVAAELGIDIPISIEARIAGAEGVGAHKTSMLQDVEAAKPLEVDGLIGTVLELGRLLGRPMPHTSVVYACAKLLGAKAVQGAAG